MAHQLTSLANVKDWLGILPNDTGADPLLMRILSSTSKFVLRYLGRPSMDMSVIETYDSYGKSFLVLKYYPVVEVLGVSFLGKPVQPAGGDGFNTPYTYGWVLENPEGAAAHKITMHGGLFPKGRSSVKVEYKSAYVQRDYAAEVPADPPFTVTMPDFVIRYISVVAAGVELQKVEGDPFSNQYSVDSSGALVFNASLAGLDVVVSYVYVPGDIEQATWELVAARYRYMDRIGYTSKSLGGQETVSFAPNRIDAYTASLLAPYRRVAAV